MRPYVRVGWFGFVVWLFVLAAFAAVVAAAALYLIAILVAAVLVAVIVTQPRQLALRAPWTPVGNPARAFSLGVPKRKAIQRRPKQAVSKDEDGEYDADGYLIRLSVREKNRRAEREMETTLR
jgi:hypothetical protein